MSNSKDDALEFLRSTGATFGQVDLTAENLRGDKGNGHSSVTETYWFEILVPGANLIAHFYIYMRPNLSMCSAGGWMSKGHVDNPLLMDHFNYQAALPMPTQTGNVVTVPQIGLTLKIVEPLKRIEILYTPPGFDVRAELTAEAVMAPAVRVTNKHFNQFMRYTGFFQIDGERIPVNNISIRDRSWGEARVEDSNKFPVTAWASGFFADAGKAFNFVGFDDPKHGVEWEGVYDIPSEKTLMDGWYLENGKLSKIVKMSKRSQRDPKNRMAPSRVEVDFEDSNGGTHHLVGITRASCWMQNWPNIYVWLPLMEWELDGAKGWGDCQEYLWTDYAKRFWK